MLANGCDDIRFDTGKPDIEGKSDIEQLAAALSVHLARKMVEHYPGVELCPPASVPKGPHHLVRNLGYENAQLLCRYASGDTIYIPITLPPSLKSGSLIKREQEIRRLVNEGVSRMDIALYLGLSQRHVRRLISKMGLSGELGKRSSPGKPNSLSRVSNAKLTGHKADQRHEPPYNTKSRSKVNSRGKRSRYGFVTIQTRKAPYESSQY